LIAVGGAPLEGGADDFLCDARRRSGTVGTQQSFAAIPRSATRSYSDHFHFSSQAGVSKTVKKVKGGDCCRDRA
jgi:hypothetical protein